MKIQNLPFELQRTILFYAVEHPCAKMIKELKFKQISMMIETVDEDTANKHFSKVYFLYYYLENLIRKVKKREKEEKRLCYERFRMEVNDKDVKYKEHKTAIILHAMWNNNYFWTPEHRLMDWKAKFSNQKDQYKYWHDF